MLHSFEHVPLSLRNLRGASRDLTMGEVAIFHFLKPKPTNELGNETITLSENTIVAGGGGIRW